MFTTDQPSSFFSFWKWLAQFLCDLSSNSLYQACWAANLSRRGELHSARRENGLSVMRNGMYIFKTHQTGNYFQISFFHFEILNCIDFYAWTICWILYWYIYIFKISLNVTQNFGIKNSFVATRPQMVCATVHQCHPWISNADTQSTNGGFITE